MIPLKINGKQLVEIFEPEAAKTLTTDDAIKRYSISKQMYPTSVNVSAEVYSRDTERTANYELETLVLVNRKVKATFNWSVLKATYAKALLEFLNYTPSFKNDDGDVVPRDADLFEITFWDLTGERTVKAYLGQTITCELKEYIANGEPVLYWEDFEISFPEV